jgi:hypothetical protein
MEKSRMDRRRRAWLLLAVAASVSMVALATAAALVPGIQSESRLESRSYRSAVALALAESGVYRAMAELHERGSVPERIRETLETGSFEMTAHAEDGAWRIDSAGRASGGGVGVRVRAVVERRGDAVSIRTWEERAEHEK